MSKNLVDEYKVQMQADIPDLWARIEASLPEKELKIDNVQANNNVVVLAPEKKKKEKQKKAMLRKMIYSFSGVAVAAIALLVVLPFFEDSRAYDKSELAIESNHKSQDKSSKSKKDKDKNAATNYVVAEEATASTATDDIPEVGYAGSKGDVDGTFINESTETAEALQDYEYEAEFEYSSSYSGVTCDVISVEPSGDRYVYKVEVTACKSEKELAGKIIYIETKEDILETGKEIECDIFLIEVEGDDKCIYSIDE